MGAGNATIYVIDDDPSFLSAVMRLVRTEGYAVDGMGTLAEFSMRTPLADPCCVLADVVLDGESGLDVQGLLASRGERAPIVFMSATDNRDQIEAANASGAVPCLRKPFEADDLFVALETALGTSARSKLMRIGKGEDVL